MVETIINTIVGYLLPTVLGFLIAKLTNYRKKNNSMKVAIMTMLQSNLTNVYFLYEPTKQIPHYMYRNFLTQLKAYEGLDGDDYIHTIAEKMKSWEIIRTDILQNTPQV